LSQAVSYSTKTNTYFSSQREEMLCFIPPNARRILEVGCGRGGFAELLRKTRDVHVTAIEPFEAAAAEAESRVDVLIRADAEDGIAQLAPQSFDCIVFNDVLEHLSNPEGVLVAVREVLRPGGVVVASIPNMRYMPVLKALVVRGEWRYTDDGVLDRTHLRFFTTKSIQEMFAACGYQPQRVEGINSLRPSWKHSLLKALTFDSFADTRHQQIVMVAGAS
jgi:methionine biosynthesis protein MetW